MSIKYDKSAESGMLITCRQCVVWFAWHQDETDKIGAYRKGEAHLERAHGMTAKEASKARREYERRLRHAAES